MRKLIKGVPQLSPSVVEPFDCDQPSPLRTKWGGKGELVLKRKIHSLEERVNNLEDIIMGMNTPWYKKLWSK